MLGRRVCHAIGFVLVSLLLIGLVIVPLAMLILPVSAETTVLTAKWTRSNMGTNWEGGLVIGDVTGDGVEDVVYAGGTTVYVLNGTSGATIATYPNSRIYRFCQPQLYDVDGDGVLDILVPLYSRPGLAAVKYDGDSSLNALWVRDVQGTSGSGSCMSKPVAGDIDGDGDLEIFIASQDVSPAYNFNNQTGEPVPIPDGYDGTITLFDHLGNILAQNFAWRPCSGGLSLGDTDNDGVFELYMGDRDIDYGDGNYGKGCRSLWAENLTERWNRLDFLSSSQAPVLIDYTGDGVLEVICGMYNEMYILNSTNGQVIKRWSSGSMSVHYGITVYDIDGDGHLELLCNDGDHDDQPYTDVFDLTTGTFDAELSMGPGVWNEEQQKFVGGDSKWSPLVADIDPTHEGMEIISVPNATGLDGGNWWHGAIMIWSSNYESLQNITRDSSNTRLGSQMAYPIVQDIDGDDLLELVTHASSGDVYAYDTSAPAPGYSSALPGSQRIRSEVTYFGEKRVGVAEYEIAPWAEDYWVAPVVAAYSPGDDSLAVPVSTSQLSFRMREHQGQPVNYTVTTLPDVGSGSGSNSSNAEEWGTYIVNLNPGSLAYDTTYTWTVTADDGTNSTVKTCSFRTELAPTVGNNPPSQTTPLLAPADGIGMTTSTFVASNQTTVDDDGNSVTNIYRWTVEGTQVANLILPFDLRNETITKDYSGYGNNGTVIGATWVEDGIVGGAYSFDGENDGIIVSDGGVGYYNNRTYASNNPELGGGGTWMEITVEAWIYLTEYNNGSRIVAKLPSYELGFASGAGFTQSGNYYNSRLIASVWPQTFEINYDDDNHASSDRQQSASFNTNLTLNTWYHIAFTYKSGEALTLYLNGVQVAQRAGVAGPLENSLGEPLYIGRLVQPFRGMIDEVRLYPHALPTQQINASYQLSKDGLSNSSSLIPVGMGASGETLTCEVIPTDSYMEGNMEFASYVLVNTPPVASNLVIYPISSSAYRLDIETLTAGYIYSDADGDLEAGSQIRWLVNGTENPDFNDLLQIPAANTSIDETWCFTVTPQDSLGGIGQTQASYNVTIRGNAAPSTDVPFLDSAGGGADFDDEDLLGSAVGTSDGDSDPTANIYSWIRNGTSMTNLQLPFDTEVPRYNDSNGVTLDYSSYGNDGSVNGSTWIPGGVIGGALSFDGNDYVRVAENSNSLGGDGSWSKISVEFWAKSTRTSTETVIFKHNVDYSSNNYGVGYRVDYRSYATGYRVYWYVYNDTTALSVNLQINEGSGQWHHVVCTYESGAGLKLYTDGVLRASLAATGNINATLDGLLDIGGIASGGTDFIGQLDEVRIYQTALSAAQIFQRFLDTRDGFSDGETIVAQETTAGDNWVCQVIPNDSWEDGTAQDSTSLHVDAVVGNSMPRIDWYNPLDLTPEVNEGVGLAFMQVSSDPDGDLLSYSWTVDSVEQATSQNWTYVPDFFSAGNRMIRVTVTDTGALSDIQEWNVTVIDSEYRTLTVLAAAANGNTDPAPGMHNYTLGSPASVSAIPDAGYVLSEWLLNGSSYGSANPAVVTMTDNFELQPIFAVGVYTLNVIVVGNGSITKNPDQEYYGYENVTLTAEPDEGYALLGWSGDASGTELFKTVLIDANLTVTATFAPQVNLVVEASGHGTTVPVPGTYVYAQGAEVTVEALPDADYALAYWLLNGTDVGSMNPYTMTMSDNSNLTAVFVLEILFSDGFESGNLGGWTSTYTGAGGSGETVAASTDYAHHDSYSGKYTTNGGGSYEYSQTRQTIDSAETSAKGVYVQGLFRITQNGIVDNTDRLKLMGLYVGTNLVASCGLTRQSGTLRYLLEIRNNGTSTYTFTAQANIDVSRWFCMELYWFKDAANGGASLWVNGDLIYQVTGAKTDNYGDISQLRLGILEAFNLASTTVYGDCVVVSNLNIEPEAITEEYILTVNLVGNGNVTKIPDRVTYIYGTSVDLTAVADAGWTFSGWSGDASGSELTTAVNITSNKVITATFTETTTPTNAYLVVRGSDDTVYYRTYDSESLTWSGWTGLPGSTPDSPAAAVCGHELHVVVRGMDGITFYHGYINLSTEQFSGWTWISGTTPSPPTLASNGTHLTLIVRGADSSIYYRTYSLASRLWSNWKALSSGQTCDKISATVVGNMLHFVVRGYSETQASDNNTLWQGSVNLDTDAFSGWIWMPGSVTSSPTLASWNDGFVLVVRGEDDSIYINEYVDSAWEGWYALSAGSTQESPAATVIGDELNLVVVGMDGVTLWRSSLYLNTNDFSGWAWISGTTPSKPTLVH